MPVKVEVSAKANLEVKTEVPPAATGRFVDAITDLIRPWSEMRGLKADLIRLHREEVGFEIARRAAARIAVEGSPTSPVPLKVLVPLLEKGSQEEASDDFMIDMWANLLVSAATSKQVLPRYVGIIGELDGHQARLLHHIVFEKPKGDHLQFFAQYDIVKLLNQELDNQPSPEGLGEKIAATFRQRGASLAGCHISTSAPDGSWEWTMEDCPEGRSPMDVETDMEVLVSLGLLQRVNITREVEQAELWYVSITYYYTTYLADYFLDVVTRNPGTVN